MSCARRLLQGLAGLLLAALSLAATGAPQADFRGEAASSEARHVANWAVHSADAAGLPFIVVDKVQSQVFVFDRSGVLQGTAPVLLGLARGDASVPGIGQRKLTTIAPQERTTPARRFVANLDRDLEGHEILWVDYDTAIALHPVVATVAKERRLQRLDSPTPADRRVTYGCINVPVRFFGQVVAAAFRNTSGIVYILPETRSARALFGSYDLVPAASGEMIAGDGGPVARRPTASAHASLVPAQ